MDRAARAQEELRSPYSGDAIDSVPVAALEDVERALLASAVRGAAVQRRTTGHEREAILRRRRPRRRARGRRSATYQRRERQVDRARRRRGARCGDLCGWRLRGRPALRRDAAARRRPRRRLRKLGFTLREPCGVVVAITPFNFPLPARAAQDRARARRGQRRGAQAGQRHAADGAGAGRDPARGRAAAAAISCLTGPGGEIGDALVRRSARAQDQLHRHAAVGEQICARRRREEAVDGAGRAAARW